MLRVSMISESTPEPWPRRPTSATDSSASTEPRTGTARVEVLLSVFRPGDFLNALLTSVWAQDYPHVSLLIRDDGSGDGTPGLITAYIAGRKDARFFEGEHVGAGKSFLALLRATDPQASYAAFCDQDDVWLPSKLSAAVAALQGLREPALYCSAVELVDRALSPIRVHRRCIRGPSFANALVENIATGCTIVLNRPGIDLVSLHSPDNFVMHDAWCYLVLAGCGTVVYDPQPQVRYRLHTSNAVGVGSSVWTEWSGRLRRHARHDHIRTLTHQAEELRRLYSTQLTPSATRSLDNFLQSQAGFWPRMLYAVRGETHFQRRLDNVIYRLLYAAHRT